MYRIECIDDRDNYCEAYYEIEHLYRLYSDTNLLNPFIDLYKFRSGQKIFVMNLTFPNKKIIMRVNLLD